MTEGRMLQPGGLKQAWGMARVSLCPGPALDKRPPLLLLASVCAVGGLLCIPASKL